MERQNTEITSEPPATSDMIGERESRLRGAESIIEQNKQNEQNNETYEDRDSPVIYQGESF